MSSHRTRLMLGFISGQAKIAIQRSVDRRMKEQWGLVKYSNGPVVIVVWSTKGGLSQPWTAKLLSSFQKWRVQISPSTLLQ